MSGGGWNIAMDALTDLVHQSQSEQGQDYYRHFVRSWASRLERDGEPEKAENIWAMAMGSVQSLIKAEPMFVSADLCELINAAADTFQREPLEPTDLITPCGFVYFEDPLLMRDIHGIERKQRALMWTTINDNEGMLLASYEDWRDKPEEGLAPIGNSHLTLSHLDAPRFHVVRTVEDESARRFMQLTCTLFRLCQQQIAVTYRERLDRPTWRRAAWKQIKEMVVFTLRRARATPTDGEREGCEVHWSHRWLVQGHWRRQPYKEDGKTVYRQIWIAPYVKGPDGKPLVFKRRAFELVR